MDNCYIILFIPDHEYKKQKRETELSVSLLSGEDEIRTRGTVTRTAV